MPKKVLFLDDRSKRLHAALEIYSAPKYELTLVVTFSEFKKFMETQEWDIVSLDHDLEFREFVDSASKSSGMEIVRWLTTDFRWALPFGMEILLHRFENDGNYHADTLFIIHSSNVVAGRMMAKLLAEADYMTKQEPFKYPEGFERT